MLVARAPAAFLELCAEPFHLAATRHGALAVRLAAEATSTFSRAGVIAWLLLSPPRPDRPLAVEQSFAAAHCAGAAALLVAYAAGAALQPRAVWPGAPRAPTRASLLLLRDFSAQALWKLALAEGDKALLLAWRAPDATGVYGLASNLGGLAARILLQPLEEAAYTMFAAARAVGGSSKDALAALLRVLLLVRAVSTFVCPDARLPHPRTRALSGTARQVSCFSAAVGPSFAFLVLRGMYGTRWAATPGAATTLGAYAVLLPLLAVNGVSEAYTAAVMTPAQLRAANGTLLAAAGTQVAVAVACKPLGATALVAGTAAGMALRIAASLHFVVADGARRTTSSLNTRSWLVALLPRSGCAIRHALGCGAGACSHSSCPCCASQDGVRVRTVRLRGGDERQRAAPRASVRASCGAAPRGRACYGARCRRGGCNVGAAGAAGRQGNVAERASEAAMSWAASCVS